MAVITVQSSLILRAHQDSLLTCFCVASFTDRVKNTFHLAIPFIQRQPLVAGEPRALLGLCVGDLDLLKKPTLFPLSAIMLKKEGFL